MVQFYIEYAAYHAPRGVQRKRPCLDRSRSRAYAEFPSRSAELPLTSPSVESDTTGGRDALTSTPFGEEDDSDYALLDLLKSRNKNVGDFSTLKGLDTKTFVLALHIAQLYNARRDSTSDEVAGKR